MRMTIHPLVLNEDADWWVDNVGDVNINPICTLSIMSQIDAPTEKVAGQPVGQSIKYREPKLGVNYRNPMGEYVDKHPLTHLGISF